MNQSKLYQYDVCPFCLKVRVGLALKKLNYDKIEVHPLNKKEISFSDYRKVPIFVDDNGEQVNDSQKILEHIDRQQQGAHLFAPLGSEERKKQDHWIEWSENYVKSIPPLLYDTLSNSLKAFDYITKVSKFSWLQRKLVKYSGALVMKMVGKKYREKYNIPNPTQKVTEYVDEWANSLEGKLFQGGTEPDVSDVAVYGITLSTKSHPHSDIFKNNKKFSAWMDRMATKTGINYAEA
jgi:microsomal prostaglandin-E synthase 2